MRYRVPAALTLALTIGLGACSDDEVGTSGAATTAAEAAPETTAGGRYDSPVTDDTTAPTTGAPVESGAATLALGETDLGSVLVDGEGMTLYVFLNDTDGVSTCNDQCADTWPALLSDAPSGGNGTNGGLIATAARDDGTTQVTYNGHPLYYFANDAAPGDTNGQGIGDVWFTIGADGEPVTG